MITKTCSRCGVAKSLTEFNRNSRSWDGLTAWCGECHREYNRLWYANPEAKKEHNRKNREWAQKNRKRIQERRKETHAANPGPARERRRLWCISVKKETVAAYGGECECCGEDRWQFLTIHHRDNDGAEERKAFRAKGNVGGGAIFYRHLKKLGFPKDRYGLLCMNCNTARAFYGKCPHEDE